jgi:hypothetical protein
MPGPETFITTCPSSLPADIDWNIDGNEMLMVVDSSALRVHEANKIKNEIVMSLKHLASINTLSANFNTG